LEGRTVLVLVEELVEEPVEEGVTTEVLESSTGLWLGEGSTGFWV
jgi:hypothetical protein